MKEGSNLTSTVVCRNAIDNQSKTSCKPSGKVRYRAANHDYSTALLGGQNPDSWGPLEREQSGKGGMDGESSLRDYAKLRPLLNDPAFERWT